MKEETKNTEITTNLDKTAKNHTADDNIIYEFGAADEKTPEEIESEKRNEINNLAELCIDHSLIDPELFITYNVNRGLRDLDGYGVLTGLTEISDVQSGRPPKGESGKEDKPGRLFYRGIEINDLVNGFVSEKRFGYEEIVYLLLFGNLPSKTQLEQFQKLLGYYKTTLPGNFVRDVIMKAPSVDMMNTLERSVLTLYAYDSNPEDTDIPNVLRQCLELIAFVPIFAVYGYQAYNHAHENNSLIIHAPQPDLSTAENILYLLRPDSKYTELEARLLDLALVLHAEHGGGNNSTFTCRVVSSSGTDTFSAIAAALGSLKEIGRAHV